MLGREYHAEASRGHVLQVQVVTAAVAEVGRFLATSIPEHYARYPLAELCDQWRAAGIGSVSARVMSFGAGVVMSGRREPW